jgi:hypothetical protein
VSGVSQYPPAVSELLASDRTAPLDAGKPNEKLRSQLAALSPADVVGGSPRDANMAKACLAGLWLYHDFLDESHTLSQDIDTTTGSYWHAIMHRREGDYGNAKYWLHRVSAHPTFATLYDAGRAEFDLGAIGPTDATREMPPGDVLKLLTAPKWDPLRFVDLCATGCNGRADVAKACLRLQKIEWRTLFDYCFLAARGER